LSRGTLQLSREPDRPLGCLSQEIDDLMKRSGRQSSKTEHPNLMLRVPVDHGKSVFSRARFAYEYSRGGPIVPIKNDHPVKRRATVDSRLDIVATQNVSCHVSPHPVRADIVHHRPTSLKTELNESATAWVTGFGRMTV